MSALTVCLRRAVVGGASIALVAVGAVPPATAAPPPFYPLTGGGVTAVHVSPAADTANVDICNPYTVTLADGSPSGSITVEIRQSVQATKVGDSMTVGFCEPFQGSNDSTSPLPADQSRYIATATSSVDSCTTASSTAQAPALSEGCEEAFFDQDGAHTIVVGVQ